MTALTLDDALTATSRTAQAIAAAIGVSPATLSQWRRGSKQVPQIRREQIERELNQPIQWDPVPSEPEPGAPLPALVDVAKDMPAIRVSWPTLTRPHIRSITGGAAVAAAALVTFPKQPAVALLAGMAGAGLFHLMGGEEKDRADSEGESCQSCGTWFSQDQIDALPEDASGDIHCPVCGPVGS